MTMILSALTSGTSTTSTTSTTSSTAAFSTLTADDYLQLLLTEIQNQDPTEPMDTSQMISSFTNLSQISQGDETNDYLKTLTEYTSAANNSQAVGFLGKTISYSSDKITVSAGTANNLSYTLGNDASDVSVTIYDTAGKAVRTVDLGSMSAGTYSLKWDGTDSSGSTVDDGSYSFKFSANDNAGNSLTVSSSAVGTSQVSGIVYKGGVSYLVTDQGEISVGSVTKVT